MKRKIAKVASIALTLAMCFSFFAFANVAEADTSDNAPVIENRMWASGTFLVPAHTSISTSSFDLEHNNFAFEVSATGSGSGTCSVKLKTISGLTKATANIAINSGTHKFDWISVNPGYHYFSIYNSTNYAITVNLTYYSF